MFFYLSFSKHTTPQEKQRGEKNEAFAYEILTPCIDCLSHKCTGVSFSQKYSMKLTAKLRQTSMCLLVSVYALVCVCVCVQVCVLQQNGICHGCLPGLGEFGGGGGGCSWSLCGGPLCW